MNEQFNQQFQRSNCNTLPAYSSNNQPKTEHSQFKAQKLIRQLSKQICANFGPNSISFNKSCFVTLHEGSPQYYLHSNLYDRQRLSTQRMGMYYRGAVDQYLSDDLINQFWHQAKTQKGYIKTKRNMSLIINHTLYFCKGLGLYALKLPKFDFQKEGTTTLNNNHQNNKLIKIYDFAKGQQVLQISLYKDYIINDLVDPMLIIRFVRKIQILSINQKKVIHRRSSSTQFISFQQSIYLKDSYYTVQYDGYSSLFNYNQIQLNNDKSQVQSLNFCIEGLITSSFNLSRNQIFLSKYQGLSSYDRRQSRQNKLLSIKNTTQDRIYSSIPLKANFTFTPYVLACQTRFLSIFDIRKLDQPIFRYLHQCEQSPPEILQFYDGQIKNRLRRPIIACHSSYSLGSFLFTQFDSQKCQLKNSQFNTSLKLLYDKGKVENMFQIYPNSLSIQNDTKQSFSFYSVDNFGEVNLQAFKFNQSYNKYEKLTFQMENMEVQLTKKSSIQKWFQNNTFQKYFQLKQKQTQQKKVENRGRKKITKTNKSGNKIKKIILTTIKSKQDLKVIDDENDLSSGQYHNDDECQQTFKKRKINHINLKHFYQTISRKSQKVNLNEIIQQKKNDISFSLSSTQPNSLSFSFEDKIENKKYINNLNHNNKFINQAMLDSLRNQWGN